MKTNMLDKKRIIEIDSHGNVTITPREFYRLYKEYSEVMGYTVEKLPDDSAIAEVRLPKKAYERVMMSILHYDGSLKCWKNYDLATDLVSGDFSIKDCAVRELEALISTEEANVLSMEENIGFCKQAIENFKKKLETL